MKVESNFQNISFPELEKSKIAKSTNSNKQHFTFEDIFGAIKENPAGIKKSTEMQKYNSVIKASKINVQEDPKKGNVPGQIINWRG